MIIRNWSAVLATGLLAIACNGAGKGDSKENKTDQPPAVDPNNPNGTGTGTGTGTTTGATGGTLDVSLKPVGALALSTSLNLVDPSVGQAAADELESLQYRIQSIQICKEMETNGTGFSNPKDCLPIYTEKDTADYENFGDAEAKADTTHYTDLMDPASVAKLSSQLTLSEKDAHDYNFGLINWYQPIKLKASLKVGDGAGGTVDVFTKEGEMVTETVGADGFKKFTTRVTNVTTGPAELAITRHSNGGAWFKFAKPFTITADDIAKKTAFKLDLTFNPDGIVKGALNNSHGQIVGVADATFPTVGLDNPTYPNPYYSIEIPMLSLTPIAHAADQKVVKETYLVHISENGDDYDVRAEIYSLEGDAAKTIYGCNLQALVSATTKTTIPMIYSPFFVEVAADGEIIMQTYDKKPIFKGFKRLAAAGDTGTAKFEQYLGAAPTEIDVTYDYVGSVTLP